MIILTKCVLVFLDGLVNLLMVTGLISLFKLNYNMELQGQLLKILAIIIIVGVVNVFSMNLNGDS